MFYPARWISIEEKELIVFLRGCRGYQRIIPVFLFEWQFLFRVHLPFGFLINFDYKYLNIRKKSLIIIDKKAYIKNINKLNFDNVVNPFAPNNIDIIELIDSV